MRNARKRWGLGAALVLVAGSLLALAAPTVASAAAPKSPPNACTTGPRSGHFVGIVPALGHCPAASASSTHVNASDLLNPSDMAEGTPPLIWHGGPVMMTPSTGPLTVTPIFWNPAGHPMSGLYKLVIDAYLLDVSRDSGKTSNVFSVANEYFGSNGQIHYNVRLGVAINDTSALPASGCTVASTDTSNIYADGSGYDACLDDTQLQAEIDHVTTARHLPHNLSNEYVLYLPQHVESCFFPGSTTTNANQCTINFQPSATFCAYHNESGSSAVYANMPYPIYESKTGFTCGNEVNFGQIESPNGNPDADIVISPTSHEINESITDPDGMTGWFDSSGFENGDECNFVYGQSRGPAGRLFNQVISGHRYLTQEEFSNNDFAITGGGCVQASRDEA